MLTFVGQFKNITRTSRPAAGPAQIAGGSTLPKQKFSGEKGAVAVEFALVLPILIMLLFGIYQFGIAYNNYLSISHAAREGARMAATGNFDQDVVEERAYPADVKSISVSYPNGQQHGQPVKVEITADVDLEIPFVLEQTITLSSSAQMRLEV